MQQFRFLQLCTIETRIVGSAVKNKSSQCMYLFALFSSSAWKQICSFGNFTQTQQIQLKIFSVSSKPFTVVVSLTFEYL